MNSNESYEDELNKSVDKFIATEFTKAELKDMKNNGKIFPDDFLEISINHACDDLMYLTLKKINDNSGGENFKSDVQKILINEIKKIFSNPEYKNESNFNTWHYTVCQRLLEVIRAHYFNKDGSKVNDGKAQKLLNMTFKYLFCFAYKDKDIYDKYEEYFKGCHMPIDSIILEWMKREKKGTREFQSSKIPRWSNMQYNDPRKPEKGKEFDNDGKYTYYKVCETAKELSEKMGLSPLKAEFIIWPKMRLKLGTEDFLRQLANNGYDDKWLDGSSRELKDPDLLFQDIQKIQRLLTVVEKDYS